MNLKRTDWSRHEAVAVRIHKTKKDFSLIESRPLDLRVELIIKGLIIVGC